VVRGWLSSLPLYWRVFVANAVLLFVAFLGLVLAPVTVSVPPELTELVVLVAGLVVVLVISLVVLRPVFRPLDELGETMRRHDPLSPGRRARVDGDPSVAALARTFNEMLERMEAERRESAHQALMVQEAERARIARELHDEVGQTLTGVMLQVEGLAAVIPDDLREQLDELRETARAGTEEVRRIARRLRPEALEDLGLQSALSALATRIADQAQIDIARHLDPRLELSPQQELVVYRVAQEALTNVVRHAGAERVELRLDREDASAVLRVRDDGRGIAPADLLSSSGIRGMRERAMLIGARLVISPRSRRGTEVKLTIPLDPT
jgi:two-component system, NarL family, sensor histidine kinase UhpB